MSISQRIEQYLHQQKIPFEILKVAPFDSLIQVSHAEKIDAKQIANTVILKDQYGLLIAVISLTCAIDFKKLKELFRRNFIRAPEDQLGELYKSCRPGTLPPLGDAYGLRTIIDDAVMEMEQVYFPMGNNTHLVKMNINDFQSLQSKAWYGGVFALAIEVKDMAQLVMSTDMKSEPLLNIKKIIESTDIMPPLPETAQKILHLSNNPYAHVKQLAEIVELDPSLAAQVVRYANSPFFNYRGTIFSVKDAIARVLGYDTVMTLALGIATARPFRIPRSGPLGLNAFWRQATYCGALCQALANEIPKPIRPRPGLAYMSGLLHNFGYLVLGHLFSHEFFLLNKLIATNPDSPLIELEKNALGVDHGEIGSWILNAWEMPQEVVVAVREHHHIAYEGVHANYSRLVLIADHLINSLGIGDSNDTELPAAILAELQLPEVRVLEVMNHIMEGCDGLNTMARQLVA